VLRHSVFWDIAGADRAIGSPVRFHEGEGLYFAVLGFAGWGSDRSVLCVFSPAKELIYKEILEATTGLCAIPEHDGDREALLVGDGNGTVNIYRLAEE
jgi:hypothetical protein